MIEAIRTYKFKKLTSFIKPGHGNDTDTDDDVKTHEKKIILPEQKHWQFLKEYPNRAESKEKFYELLNYLKNKRSWTRNIANFEITKYIDKSNDYFNDSVLK